MGQHESDTVVAAGSRDIQVGTSAGNAEGKPRAAVRSGCDKRIGDFSAGE